LQAGRRTLKSLLRQLDQSPPITSITIASPCSVRRDRDAVVTDDDRRAQRWATNHVREEREAGMRAASRLALPAPTGRASYCTTVNSGCRRRPQRAGDTALLRTVTVHQTERPCEACLPQHHDQKNATETRRYYIQKNPSTRAVMSLVTAAVPGFVLGRLKPTGAGGAISARVRELSLHGGQYDCRIVISPGA
jgi:hypothetical protein